MKERDVVEYLKRRVDATGGEYRKLSYEGRTGAPDYLIFYPVELDCTITVPIACFVEVKAPGEKPSVIQQLEIRKLKRAGFNACVVASVEEVDRLVKRLSVIRNEEIETFRRTR